MKPKNIKNVTHDLIDTSELSLALLESIQEQLSDKALVNDSFKVTYDNLHKNLLTTYLYLKQLDDYADKNNIEKLP
jgi:hypothetical protein